MKGVIKGIGGLNYIEIRGVPVRKKEGIGEVIEVPPIELERFVAAELIKANVPLRGLEVSFLRKVLGMSMDQFARKLGLTAASVFKWERNATRRLARVNEFAVVGLASSELGISPPSFADLSPEDSPRHLTLVWGAKRKKAA
jgi:DNA-binding transcriptional regulator YiaG